MLPLHRSPNTPPFAEPLSDGERSDVDCHHPHTSQGLVCVYSLDTLGLSVLGCTCAHSAYSDSVENPPSLCLHDFGVSFLGNMDIFSLLYSSPSFWTLSGTT